ncbi:small ribosomal subunit Rsm22 family protein [Verrucomicrobiota bacterium sgz303538]
MKHFTPRDLAVLNRLREGFLSGRAGDRDYWRSEEELALYNETFAERIGWKWDAVLRELHLRGWEPQSRHLLDWGCGSGVAGRRVLHAWPGRFESLTLHDRSPKALRFAVNRARAEFPALKVLASLPDRLQPDTLVVLSHVINELPAPELARLLALAAQAREIIWVEAGTHADSRKLIDVRERMKGKFAVIAPCTHSERCGLLSEENARHWCHHFAPVPPEAFQDGRWAELSREIGIDLRALPYSFLVLDRQGAERVAPAGFSRVIGEPREFKGYSKVLSCQAEGVSELMLQKRDAPELLKSLYKGDRFALYQWSVERGKIVKGTPLIVESE